MVLFNSMSADLGAPSGGEAGAGGAPVYVDPVANFNAINEHAVPPGPREYPPIPDPNGDPIAVEEAREAIHENGGRITFGRYMDIALYGRAGYYSTGKVNFQAYGDDAGEFFTSPEQSSDFSRVMAVGVCAILGAMGNQPFNLLELGAGSGRMLKDVLAALRNENPAVYGHTQAYIADYGGMRARQERVIGSNERAHTGSYAAMSTDEEHAQDLGKVSWVPDSALEQELDNGRPTIVISNEVPDAVRTEVVRNNEGVLEQKYVALNDANELIEEWGPLTTEVQEYVDTYGTTVDSGKEVSVSPAVVALHRRICRLIRRGGWINVDYGDDGPKQHPNKPPVPIAISFDGYPRGENYEAGAVRTYPPNYNPLQRTGDVDLTHNPDFTVIRRVVAEEGMTEVFYDRQGRGIS
jgi:SAM-dependent MidA family methyltransferase